MPDAAAWARIKRNGPTASIILRTDTAREIGVGRSLQRHVNRQQRRLYRQLYPPAMSSMESTTRNRDMHQAGAVSSIPQTRVTTAPPSATSPAWTPLSRQTGLEASPSPLAWRGKDIGLVRLQGSDVPRMCTTPLIEVTGGSSVWHTGGSRQGGKRPTFTTQEQREGESFAYSSLSADSSLYLHPETTCLDNFALLTGKHKLLFQLLTQPMALKNKLCQWTGLRRQLCSHPHCQQTDDCQLNCTQVQNQTQIRRCTLIYSLNIVTAWAEGGKRIVVEYSLSPPPSTQANAASSTRLTPSPHHHHRSSPSQCPCHPPRSVRTAIPDPTSPGPATPGAVVTGAILINRTITLLTGTPSSSPTGDTFHVITPPLTPQTASPRSIPPPHGHCREVSMPRTPRWSGPRRFAQLTDTNKARQTRSPSPCRRTRVLPETGSHAAHMPHALEDATTQPRRGQGNLCNPNRPQQPSDTCNATSGHRQGHWRRRNVERLSRRVRRVSGRLDAPPPSDELSCSRHTPHRQRRSGLPEAKPASRRQTLSLVVGIYASSLNAHVHEMTVSLAAIIGDCLSTLPACRPYGARGMWGTHLSFAAQFRDALCQVSRHWLGLYPQEQMPAWLLNCHKTDVLLTAHKKDESLTERLAMIEKHHIERQASQSKTPWEHVGRERAVWRAK
ncbi:hypothetical protein DFH27DRAFT_529341 [Peziza echinospora]|nr:hypothetical protein DFH27DRAFT_529341 [Peziza echinospora]